MLQKQIYTNLLYKVNFVRVSSRFFCNNKNETKNNDNIVNRQRFLRQSQGLRAFQPEECPKNPTIVLFPGQGSQFVGMAKSLVDIPDARDLFEIASEILRLDQQ